MNLSDALALAHGFLAQHLPPEQPDIFHCFISVSNGRQRATVVCGSGSHWTSAWREATRTLHKKADQNTEQLRWLRVDWVTQVYAHRWTSLDGLLRKTKRNYFRKGIALDKGFKRAFLEAELHANAMLYPGARINHAQLNEKNFTRYLRLKYGAQSHADFTPNTAVYSFLTEAVLVDDKGELHSISGKGRDSGRRDVEALTPALVRQLIQNGSDFLARQVQSSGRFVYGIHPCFDRRVPAYNALRHASSTYAMLEAWEVTGSTPLRAAIERSLQYLCNNLIQTRSVPCGNGAGETAAFLVDVGDEIKLGGNAVCILALTKYTELTQDNTYRALLHQLALGIEHMQNPETGQFVHVLQAQDLSVKEPFRIIYYDGEAAFGLMRLYGLTRDPRWLMCVERAFTYFIAAKHWQAHDHWLSYCVNELTRYRPEARYYQFGIQNVNGYLDFVLNRITTYPTLLELMMAAHKMITRLRRDAEHAHLLEQLDVTEFYRALEYRAQYLLNGHFWPELAMYFQKPESVLGSFFIRHHSFRVRIDDVEHYLSGYVAYLQHYLTTESKSELPQQHFIVSGSVQLNADAALVFEIMRTAAMRAGCLINARQAKNNRVWLTSATMTAEAEAWLGQHAPLFGWTPEDDEDSCSWHYSGNVTIAEARQVLFDTSPLVSGVGVPCWSADSVALATGGHWRVEPATSWQASGLCIALPTLKAGQIVTVRPVDGKRGLTVAQIRAVLRKGNCQIAGLMAQDQWASIAEFRLPILAVQDVGTAVLNFGFSARSLLGGKVIGVTGSSGKTTVCALLEHLLSFAGQSAGSRHSANLPHGLAWNLASMPFDADYVVLEMAIGGMGVNSLMARPDIAVFLNVSAAHLIHHRSTLEIADKKSRLFLGMSPDGVAVINRDMKEYSVVAAAAKELDIRLITFGCHQDADYRLMTSPEIQSLTWQVNDQTFNWSLTNPETFCSVPLQLNVLAAIAVLEVLGVAIEQALPALSTFAAPAGRGNQRDLMLSERRICVTDESYNANPDSMRAALDRFANLPKVSGKSWLVLGDMLELGADELALHRELATAIKQTKADRVLLFGSLMSTLESELKKTGQSCQTFTDLSALQKALIAELSDGDRVLIKASHGTGLHALITYLGREAVPEPQ